MDELVTTAAGVASELDAEVPVAITGAAQDTELLGTTEVILVFAVAVAGRIDTCEATAPVVDFNVGAKEDDTAIAAMLDGVVNRGGFLRGSFDGAGGGGARGLQASSG